MALIHIIGVTADVIKRGMAIESATLTNLGVLGRFGKEIGTCLMH